MSTLPRVVVEDVGLDAVMMDLPDGQGRVLVLNPSQSFGSAVAAVRHQLPHLREDEARSLVRRHLPDVPDVHAMWAEGLPTTPPPVLTMPRRPLSGRWALAATLVLGGAAMGAGIAMTVLMEEPRQVEVDSVFQSPDYTYLAARTGLHCERIAELTARCTEPNGEVSLAEAAITNTGVLFMFTAGDQQVTVRAFQDAGESSAWLRQPANANLPNVRLSGRYAMWGTDEEALMGLAGAMAPQRVPRPT